MIMDYYHYFLTCPHCHEPHGHGSPIKIVNDEFAKCSACDVNFFRKIDLSEFPEVCKDLNIDKKIKMPLVWQIKPNCIEKSYLEWINEAPIGKYLITWPWKKVKFLPLLASEFLKTKKTKKIAIIGDIKKHNKSGLIYPHINNILNNIIYSKEKVANPVVERKVKTDINHFRKKNVLIKNKKTYFVIKRIGTKDHSPQRTEEIFPGPPKKCRNELFNDLKEEYGEKCIRFYNKGSKPLNKNGIIDINIGERQEWGGELKYNKLWFFKVLYNFNKLNNINKLITPQIIEENSNQKLDKHSNVFLISDEINPNFIFQTIENINPELVLIENIDDFIKEVIYGGSKSRELFRFLNKFEGLVLMFSTNPDARHLFNLDAADNLIERYSITLHTWDSGLVLENVKDLLKEDMINPLSNNMSELPFLGHKPEITYSVVDQLSFIDDILIKIENVNKNYEKFFLDLKKTPLYLRSEKNKYYAFKRHLAFDSELNFEKIMIQIKRNDKELFQELYPFFIEKYGIRSEQENPLLERILQILKEHLKPDNNVIISIVVHGNDVKGMKSLLHEKGFDERFSEKINVVKWSNLFLIEQEIDARKQHIVISTRPPSLDYQLYFSKKVDKFIFVGSKEDIDGCKNIVDKRLIEYYVRPLKFIYDEKKAPHLLINILNEIHSNEDWGYIEKFKLVETVAAESNQSYAAKTGKIRHKIIKSGEEAVLVSDTMGQFMLLPLNKDVFFKVEDGNGVNEIQIKKSGLKNIVNQEIIIDKRGVYTSFKHIFTKFMIENAQMSIRSRLKSWDNFYELIVDSSEWIGVLRLTLKKIMNEKKISLSEAEEELSTFLSELNLTAKRKNYFKNWWSEPEYIQTEYGMIPVYDIEHTKSPEDMKKIYENIKKEYIPDMELTIKDAEKSYIASRQLQKIRRDFFKSTKVNYKMQNRIVYEMLNKEIKKIIEASKAFKIVTASTVVLKDDAHALETIDGTEIIKLIKN